MFEYRNGNIVGYECRITEENGWSDVDTVYSSTEKVFEKLTPYTNYKVQIAAMTSAGIGPYSEPVIARTREASMLTFIILTNLDYPGDCYEPVWRSG